MTLHRRFRALWIVVAYLFGRELLGWMTAQRSLLTPGGGLDLPLAALTLVVLVLRLASVFVVPGVVLVRLLRRRIPPD